MDGEEGQVLKDCLIIKEGVIIDQEINRYQNRIWYLVNNWIIMIEAAEVKSTYNINYRCQSIEGKGAFAEELFVLTCAQRYPG